MQNCGTLSECLGFFFFFSLCCSAALPFVIMTIIYQPYQRGVYCDDESIRYPYKSDTISHGMMATVTITCSIVIVSLYHFSSNHQS